MAEVQGVADRKTRENLVIHGSRKLFPPSELLNCLVFQKTPDDTMSVLLPHEGASTLQFAFVNIPRSLKLSEVVVLDRTRSRDLISARVL